MLPNTTIPPDPEWDRIFPHLEAALADLSPIERAAVIVHCLNSEPITRHAAALDLTEAAARRRLKCALRRLNTLLNPQTRWPRPNHRAWFLHDG